MTGHAGRYAGVMAAAAVVVLAVGGATTGPAGRRGVVVGVAAALVVQGIAFWLVERPRARGARLAAQAAGMVLRLAALLAVALGIAPRLGVPQVPTVFALGSMLFVGITAEPLLYVLYRNQQR